MDEKVVERFYKKIGTDWKWKGSKDGCGYGRIKINGKYHSAHRVSYIIFNGEIPEGMSVLHSCDNPGCVNPKHLHLGTQADNMREMAERGRSQRGENHNNSKLTNKQVIDIRKKYELGLSQTVIGKEYNISNRYVSMIVNKKRWKHI